MKLNILFIINPISGGKSKLELPKEIGAELDHLKFNACYRFTEFAGHASEIAVEAIQNGNDLLVAVGGDGTINEVGSVAKRHQKTLGIIPFGSGNGLARHLGIPMSVAKAVQLLNRLETVRIDTGTFNGKTFYNIAGVGFDAHVSAVFAADKNRGLAGYVKLGLREMIRYQPEHYQLTIDNRKIDLTAYAISIANSSQYGNNIFIAPNASLTDGLLDVCIVRKFPLYKVPLLLLYAIRGKTDESGMVEVIQGKSIRIVREKSGSIHIDGEPLLMEREIEVAVDPSSLTVIAPLKDRAAAG